MNSEMEAMVGLGIIAIVYLLMLGIGVTNYILTSLSLYTIADRRGISNPWLAWLPVVNSWTIGAIADDYDSRNGMKRKWRLLLLILNLIIIVFIVTFIAVFFVSLISVSMELNYYAPDVEEMLEILLPMYAFGIMMSVTSVAAQMCTVICLYKIYESTVPEKSVLFLLISLLVPLGNAICLMICRKKGYSNHDPISIAVIAEFPAVNEAEDLPSEE